ncbi:hypothetical protein D3C77_686620 [compost metagenome]
MMRQAGRGPVFRRHQRQQQHILAADFAVQTHPGVDPFHFWRLADIDRQHFIQRQAGIQRHHRRHQLGDRGDRHHFIGVT